MTPPLSVGIVGAGYAGAAAALFLERQGHDVTVYEAVHDPTPVGAGILLQPTGQEVLAMLGLLEPVRAQAAPVTRLRCRTPGNRLLFDLPYAESAPGLVGLGLHRGVLFEALFRAVQESRTTVQVGVRILGRASDDSFEDDRGRRHGPHDLLVVADGARSQLRARNFPGVRDREYPWGALWIVGEDPEPVFEGELHQVVETTRKMTGFLPTGRAPGGATNLTSLFWSLRVDAADAFRRQPLQAWKDEVLRFEPRAEGLLAQIVDHEQLLFAAYRDVSMPSFVRGRLVFIGDAAHAMSPQLGQGSNLALMDAMTLAQAVAHGQRHGLNVPAILAEYEAARSQHVRFYEFANRLCTPFFQADGSVNGWLRDTFFPIAAAIPYIRRRMVRTMCGLELGVLGPPLPTPRLTAGR